MSDVHNMSKTMRLFLVLLISFITFLPVYAGPLSIGDTAPNWTLPNPSDDALEYYLDSEDKVSIILFWATWCPYCAKLMPHLQAVYQKYRDKGLRLYAIDIYEDGDLDPVSYFVRRGYTFNLLLYGDSIADLYGIKGTPGLLLVDKNKKIIYTRKSGANEEQVKQDIEQLIEQNLK